MPLFDAEFAEFDGDGTLSVTVASNSNRVLYVLYDCDTAPSSVSRDGQNFTKIKDTGAYGITLWRLVAPNTGTANVTATGSLGSIYSQNAWSVYNADQTTPERDTPDETINGSGPANPNVITLTTVADDLVLDLVQLLSTGGAGSMTAGGGQTGVLDQLYSNTDYRYVSSYKTATSTSTNMQWTAGSTPNQFYSMTWAVRPSATAYTITANAGAYTFTGTAASLEYGREVAAATGTVTVTGTAASLEVGREVAAAPGAVTITGTAAALYHAAVLVAGAGTYSITGTAAALGTVSTAGLIRGTIRFGAYASPILVSAPSHRATLYADPSHDATLYADLTHAATLYADLTTRGTIYLDPTTRATLTAQPSTRATISYTADS